MDREMKAVRIGCGQGGELGLPGQTAGMQGRVDRRVGGWMEGWGERSDGRDRMKKAEEKDRRSHRQTERERERERERDMYTVCGSGCSVSVFTPP